MNERIDEAVNKERMSKRAKEQIRKRENERAHERKHERAFDNVRDQPGPARDRKVLRAETMSWNTALLINKYS